MVDYEVHGHIGVLALNRPEARNAVNDVVAQSMTENLERMEADPDVWVGVLTANTTGHTSPVFCAGADLKMINAGRAGDLATKKGGCGGFTTSFAVLNGKATGPPLNGELIITTERKISGRSNAHHPARGEP